MKKIKHTKIAYFAILGAFVVMMVAAVMTMGEATRKVDEVGLAGETEIILADAEANSGSLTLAADFFDQKQDPCVNIYDVSKRKKLKARQFEWASCGYNESAIEQEMMEWELSEAGELIAKGGKTLPNRGLTNILRWFSEVDGKSKKYAKTIDLNYKNDGELVFNYGSEEFYPLDEAKFSKSDKVNADRHNHLFTMNFAVPFVVQGSGEESFEILADDDTFVYVGGKLVIDMGGVHEATAARFRITEAGEIYAGIGEEELAYSGVRVEGGKEEKIQIFHADRNAKESVFKMELTNMNVVRTDARLAEADGAEIAYEDMGKQAPLGVAKETDPSTTKGYIIIMTTTGVLIVAFAVLIVMVTRIILREK